MQPTPISSLTINDSPRRKVIWAAGALVGLIFLAHGPALWGSFIWDDYGLITQNRLIRAPDGLWQYWFTTRAPDYFPLTSTTWWLEWRLWGEHPAGYHLTNLLLHAGSALLLWQILRELKLPGAWLAAAMWGAHPVQVESVAWIAERKNTLSVALAAVSMLLLLRYFKCELATDGAQIHTDREKKKSAFHLCSSVPHLWLKLFLPALLTFTAALLAKTAVAPLPIVMLICARRYGRTWRRALVETIPFFVITAALSAVTIFFQSQRSIAADVVRTDSLLSRIAIAGKAVWFYLFKLIWPTPLAFVYPRWATGNVSPHAFIPLLLLAIVFIALWLGRRRWDWGPLLAMAYFVLMLLPVLGLLNIYFMRYSLVADHWQYAASIGPIALVAAMISRARIPYQWLIAGLVLLPLVILSERQALLYRSSEILWTDTIDKNRTSWMAQISLGHALSAEHHYAEAERHYETAAAIAPDLAEPYFSIGSVLAQQGKYADAITEYEKAIERNSHIAAMYSEMAHCLIQINQLDRALTCYGQAVARDPDNADVRYQQGLLLDQLHRRADAISAYEAAVARDPDLAIAEYNLAKDLLSNQRLPEAVDHLKNAVRAEPNWAQARVDLAHALLLQGDQAGAAAQFAEALRIDQNRLDTRPGLEATGRVP